MECRSFFYRCGHYTFVTSQIVSNRDGWFKWLLRKQLCNGGIFITELIYTLATVERRSLQLPLNFQPVKLNECIHLPCQLFKWIRDCNTSIAAFS